MGDHKNDYDIQFAPSATHSELLQNIRTALHGHPPLLTREFSEVSSNAPRNTSGCSKGDADCQPARVRVMQWNQLARALCQGDDNFVKCPKEAFDWKSRRLHILEEILQYEPDIVCLEEVDQFDFFKSVLGSICYEGTFFPKPDSPCLSMEESYGPDGCAIFYNTNKLRSVSVQNFNLKMGNKSTNQVAIIQQLQYCDSKNPRSAHEFYIGVTHLKSKVGWEETRRLQGQSLLEVLMEKAGSSPVILCGDFNAVPEEPVYSVFKNSQMGFDSAYTKLTGDGVEPLYTTWKIRGGKHSGEVCRTIDYVWYTKGTITVEKVLKFPTGEEIGPGRLPSVTYPSDHLSLVCDLSIH
ncbi:nocturnin [Lingula anatina]|uniref:Nocturnin n=1 Tax=Lingula anatina TaxID=7574 RepID=A0A1S3IXF7_LINAN|nr:nocturnin [Lingula anatina]|eukprot:XP_013402229.1 nocturnin [Lingula anatina]